MDVIQWDVVDTTGLPNFQLSCVFSKWMIGKYWREIRHVGSISRKTSLNSADVKLYSLRSPFPCCVVKFGTHGVGFRRSFAPKWAAHGF